VSLGPNLPSTQPKSKSKQMPYYTSEREVREGKEKKYILSNRKRNNRAFIQLCISDLAQFEAQI